MLACILYRAVVGLTYHDDSLSIDDFGDLYRSIQYFRLQ